MNIFCVNEPRPSPHGSIPNYDALREHGPVVFIFTRREWPAKYPEDALRILDQRLLGFRPETDAIAFLGGDPFALLLIGIWAKARKTKSLLWMRYESIEGRVTFVPTPVPVDQLQLMEHST